MHPTAHLIVANGRISDMMVEANQSRLANSVAVAKMATRPSAARRLVDRIGRSVHGFGHTIRSSRSPAI